MITLEDKDIVAIILNTGQFVNKPVKKVYSFKNLYGTVRYCVTDTFLQCNPYINEPIILLYDNGITPDGSRFLKESEK